MPKYKGEAAEEFEDEDFVCEPYCCGWIDKDLLFVSRCCVALSKLRCVWVCVWVFSSVRS